MPGVTRLMPWCHMRQIRSVGSTPWSTLNWPQRRQRLGVAVDEFFDAPAVAAFAVPQCPLYGDGLAFAVAGGPDRFGFRVEPGGGVCEVAADQVVEVAEFVGGAAARAAGSMLGPGVEDRCDRVGDGALAGAVGVAGSQLELERLGAQVVELAAVGGEVCGGGVNAEERFVGWPPRVRWRRGWAGRCARLVRSRRGL
jgi:hypothetical protein